MAEANKSTTLPRRQANAAGDNTTAAQQSSQRWAREFRTPATTEANDAAMTPARRHIDEYA
jgi:hypothetical protein